MSDDVDQVIVVPRNDPVYSVFCWRDDSITLARLKPVLEELRWIPNQPCLMHLEPENCIIREELSLCVPCAIRQIKTVLFGPDTT